MPARFDTSRSLARLVRERESRIPVFERFGLDFCCRGRRSLARACRDADVPLGEVVEALQREESRPEPARRPVIDGSHLTRRELIDYIVSKHHSYLRRILPALEEVLETIERVHGATQPQLKKILTVFKDLKRELDAHLVKEERDVFPALLREKPAVASAKIPELEAEHDHVGQALRRLRNLSGGYSVPKGMCSSYRAAMSGLRDLEEDTHIHIHLENNDLFTRPSRKVRK